MTKNDDKFTIPEGVLSDICSRFIINVPEEERSDLIRIFFQIEIAHWFYLDFYCDSNLGTDGCSGSSSNNSPTTSSGSSSSSSDDEDSSNENLVHRKPNQHYQLKPCSIRTFAENIFRHCPFLMQHSNQVDDILSKWKVFKHAVPTNGAIILDETMRYVLLVQGFWAKASWGFPKGKVFEEESEAKCAQREVLEETGYDITSQLVEDQYLQININDQTIRLYIVTGVSKKTEFAPRTRREIKEVRWFPLEDLPMHRKDTRCKQTLGYSPNSFFMVIPFVKALKQWISIKNGSLDGQIVNGTIVTSNSASKFLHSANRPHSTTINHKRHNSTSQQNQQQLYQNNNHHNHNMSGNHHHHHHHQHHNNNDRNQNSGYSNYKKISKSNENLASIGQNINTISYSNQQNYLNNKSLNNSNNNNKSSSSTGAANSKSLKFNFKSAQNNPFLKHYTAFNSNAYNNVNEPISPITGDSFNSNSNLAASVALNIKQQSQYYHKIQQSEFADLLGFKEAAIANKNKNKQQTNNKNISPTNNNSNNISLNSNSKFKPVNSNNNNVNNSNKKSNNSNLNNNSSLNNQHHSYSTPAALSINNNITNLQHIQPNNNNNNNNSNSNRKNHNQPNLQSQSQNNFKDIITNNNMLKNSTSLNYNMNHSHSNNNNQHHNHNHHHHQFNNNKINNNNTNSNANNLKRVKKQLEFNGPECWINFKFDYDAISQVLPQPLLDL